MRALVLVLVALLAACGDDAPDPSPVVCRYPLVACEGDPALCPVLEPSCREVSR